MSLAAETLKFVPDIDILWIQTNKYQKPRQALLNFYLFNVQLMPSSQFIIY